MFISPLGAPPWLYCTVEAPWGREHAGLASHPSLSMHLESSEKDLYPRLLHSPKGKDRILLSLRPIPRSLCLASFWLQGPGPSLSMGCGCHSQWGADNEAPGSPSSPQDLSLPLQSFFPKGQSIPTSSKKLCPLPLDLPLSS